MRQNRLWRISFRAQDLDRWREGEGKRRDSRKSQDKSVWSVTIHHSGAEKMYAEEENTNGTIRTYNIRHCTHTYIYTTSTHSAVTFHKHQNIVRTYYILYYHRSCRRRCPSYYCALLFTNRFFIIHVQSHRRKNRAESFAEQTRRKTRGLLSVITTYACICVYICALLIRVAAYRVSSRRDPSTILCQHARYDDNTPLHCAYCTLCTNVVKIPSSHTWNEYSTIGIGRLSRSR